MDRSEEFQYTISLAEDSIWHIRKNYIPAYPKTYEVWYSHLTGRNKELSAAIEDIYEKYGRVSPTQILHLHDTYLSNNPLGDSIDEMSNKITAEAAVLERIVKQSFGLSQTFDGSLKQAAADLQIDLDQAALQKLIKRMLLETTSVEQQNQDIIEQLKTAHEDIKKLRSNLEEIREETIMDQLTMIGNRRHFDRSLANAIADHQLTGNPLCLVLADIDHFKSFNDKWGHQTGDQVLRLVALAIKSNVKVEDIPCRYGGEEFAIILPNVTLEQGNAIAERIRAAVARRDVVKRSSGTNLGKVTISAGVSILRIGDTSETLIHRADLCLYAAKNAGRNKIVDEKGEEIRSVA